MSKPASGRRRTTARMGAAALLAGALVCGAASALELVVQPDPGRESGAAPALAARLSAAIGQPVRLVVHRSMLAHWRAVRVETAFARLVVDDAHFTDYRVERLGYRVLAGLEGTVSFALVTAPGAVVLSPDELAGQRIAGPAPPSLGAARLLGIVPGGLRAPVLVEANGPDAAVARLGRAGASAALIPDSSVWRFPRLRVVFITEATPAMALSASPAVAAEIADAVRAAVLAEGARGRERAGDDLAAFGPASAALYAGYGRLLRGAWGY